MRRILLLVSALSLFSFSVIAQDSEKAEPEWLVLERGKVAFEEGEFGDALLLFRSILSGDSLMPEAHYWVGRVFEEEGELGLAEKEYTTALDYRHQLYVLQQEISIRERLARLYKLKQEFPRFETELLAILNIDKEYDTPENMTMQAAMLRVLSDQGLEQVFKLYRLDRGAYFLSHAELGLFYYRTGRYSDASVHLMTAGLTVLTRSLEYLHNSAPFTEFTTPGEVLEGALALEKSAEFLNQTHAAALFYYLGAAMYAQGEIASFREIMTLVRDVFTETQWRNRAISQLADPYIEPVITSKDFFYFF